MPSHSDNCNGFRVLKLHSSFNLQYSREQKHVLLFRKSGFFFSKSWILTCRNFFSWTQRFCFWSLKAEVFSILLIWDFVNPHKISADLHNFYFWHPMLLITFDSMSNMGVNNQEVLLLVTIRYLQTSRNIYGKIILHI